MTQYRQRGILAFLSLKLNLFVCVCVIFIMLFILCIFMGYFDSQAEKKTLLLHTYHSYDSVVFCPIEIFYLLDKYRFIFIIINHAH